jgi:hypothetical protein
MENNENNRKNRVVDRMAFLTPSTERLRGIGGEDFQERKALSSLASAFNFHIDLSLQN